MILLLGTTPDDILYIKNRMIMSEKGALKGQHFYYVGHYAGKEICMTYTGNSNLMGAVIASYMIRKFDPYLVIAIGSCSSASEGLHQGDLFIAERVYIGDIDYNSFEDKMFTSALHMSSYYITEDMYLRHLERLNSASSNYRLVRGPLIAANKFFTKKEEADALIAAQENFLVGKVAFDTEMGGIVTCSRFYEVPWILIKSINYEIGKDDQLLSHVRKGVEAQPRVGELIEQLFVFLNTSLEDSM